jgi:hypothetical protein
MEYLPTPHADLSSPRRGIVTVNSGTQKRVLERYAHRVAAVAAAACERLAL